MDYELQSIQSGEYLPGRVFQSKSGEYLYNVENHLLSAEELKAIASILDQVNDKPIT